MCVSWLLAVRMPVTVMQHIVADLLLRCPPRFRPRWARRKSRPQVAENIAQPAAPDAWHHRQQQGE